MLKHVAGLVLLFLATAELRLAHAHSWYPNECCSNQDCVAASAMLTGAEGRRVVIVGHIHVSIPDDFPSRASPDGRIHICFRTVAGELYSEPYYLLLCLFLPAES